nr:hypothetical protein [Tanacetum cinerariifolium]
MDNTRTDAELATTVQNALQTLLPQIRAEIREEFRTAPVDAENWISHMEKIFDVMGCKDAFKTRLAVYKFEGDALAWWKAYKQAKAAGTAEEQAKNFQWGLRKSTLNHLMCIPFMDVAQVTNAARNYGILHERDDDGAERPDKRQKSGDRHQSTTQQSSHRNHGHNNDRHGSDRRGGGDNYRSNNNYSSNNNRSFGNGRDQRNRGQQSNRPVDSGFQHVSLNLLGSSEQLLVLRRSRQRTSSGVFASLPLTTSYDDDDTERLDKRQKSGDRHQPTTQQSSHRNYGHNNDRHGSDRRGGDDNHRSNNNYSENNNRLNFKSIRSLSTHKHDPNITSRGPSEGYSYPVCTTCGRRHPRECHRAAGTCFKFGQTGHLQKDCKKNTVASTSGQVDKKPGASGRVFAITEDHATKTS